MKNLKILCFIWINIYSCYNIWSFNYYDNGFLMDDIYLIIIV